MPAPVPYDIGVIELTFASERMRGQGFLFVTSPGKYLGAEKNAAAKQPPTTDGTDHTCSDRLARKREAPPLESTCKHTYLQHQHDSILGSCVQLLHDADGHRVT